MYRLRAVAAAGLEQLDREVQLSARDARDPLARALARLEPETPRSLAFGTVGDELVHGLPRGERAARGDGGGGGDGSGGAFVHIDVLPPPRRPTRDTRLRRRCALGS